MKRLDFVIIALVAACSLVPLLLFGGGGESGVVTVTLHGETVYRGPIDTDTVIEAGAGNTVAVENSVVTMSRADCPDGLCLRGHASGGHPLVCLPNGVVVTVERREEALDGVTY